MPQGVILSSSSIGAKKEDVERVLAGAGLEVEVEEPETPEVPAEPKLEDFDDDVAFEEAHVKWQEETAPKESDEDEEEEEETPAPKAKVSKFKKRISRIVAPIERENAELKRRLDELEKKSKGGKEGEDETRAEENPRPKKADFKTDEEYEDALLAWGVKKATIENAQKDAVTRQREQLAENLKTYLASISEFKETVEDFEETVKNEDIPLHPYVQTVIMNPAVVPNPGPVVYYLGKHPEFALKMAEKDIQAQIVEVGRLSDRLLKAASGSAGSAAGRREKPQPKHRAPAPIRPVSTAATSSTLTSADAAKARNYKAFKAAQRAGR